jgi:hypothetical protein
MTLVVSDISIHGIIMVGDSAVTKRSAFGVTVAADAVKVQYCSKANAGFALWGNAGTTSSRMDSWLDQFIQKQIHTNDPVEEIGKRLADSLNTDLAKANMPWKDLVRGIHLSGYREGIPVLFHIHNGHDNELAHELRVYKDYPDDQKWSEHHYQFLLAHAFLHLRNGYHPLFAPLFKRALDYAAELRANYNMTFPQNNLQGRFEFYKLLVKFVAGTLIAAGLHPGVNDTLSAIAFNKSGLVMDERLMLPPASGGEGTSNFDEIL